MVTQRNLAKKTGQGSGLTTPPIDFEDAPLTDEAWELILIKVAISTKVSWSIFVPNVKPAKTLLTTP